MLASRSCDTGKASNPVVIRAFENHLRAGEMAEANKMLTVWVFHLSSDAVKPSFIKVANELLDEHDITAAINLLGMYRPSSESSRLKSEDVAQSKPKVVAGVRWLLAEGLMTDDLIKSVLGAETLIHIKPKDLEAVFLEGINELVYKGWSRNTAVDAVAIALHRLGMKLEDVRPVIREARDRLMRQGWVHDADAASALLRMTDHDFLAAIGEDRVPVAANHAAVQLRMV